MSVSTKWLYLSVYSEATSRVGTDVARSDSCGWLSDILDDWSVWSFGKTWSWFLLQETASSGLYSSLIRKSASSLRLDKKTRVSHFNITSDILDKRFPNCGSWPKSGSWCSVKWVAIIFLKKCFLRRLFGNSKNLCYKQRSKNTYLPVSVNYRVSLLIFEANFSTTVINFIQWVSTRPWYLQVGPDPEKFGKHCLRPIPFLTDPDGLAGSLNMQQQIEHLTTELLNRLGINTFLLRLQSALSLFYNDSTVQCGTW